MGQASPGMGPCGGAPQTHPAVAEDVFSVSVGQCPDADIVLMLYSEPCRMPRCSAISAVLGREGCAAIVGMESGGVAMWWSTPYDEVQCIVCDEILGEQPVACVGVDPLLTSMMLDRGRLQGELLFASGNTSGEASIWALTSSGRLRLRRKWAAHASLPAPGGFRRGVVDVSLGGDSITTGGADGSVGMWEVDAVSCDIAEAERAHGAHGGATSATSASSCCLAASGGEDGVVKLWRRGDERDGRPLPAHRRTAEGAGAILRLALDEPNGRICAGADDGLVRLWDIISFGATRRFAHRPTGCSSFLRGVTAVAFDTDDAPSLLASGGKDGSCRLWDIRQRDRSPVVEEREAHSKPIASICVWGDRLMTASAGGFCAIWDLRSVDRSLRQPLCEFDIFGRSLTKKRKHAGGLRADTPPPAYRCCYSGACHTNFSVCL